mgnify:CR=1 FL=1
MNDEIELKPCPFCGGTKLDVSDEDYVYCNTCDARGPSSYAENEEQSNYELWNERANA